MTEPLITARDAMQRAVERAQVGDYEGGHVWTAIARELRVGAPLEWPRREPAPRPAHPTCVESTSNAGMAIDHRTWMCGPECPSPPVAVRAETEVMERVQTESTPAYEAASEDLGDTRAIQVRVAHPQDDSEGPNSTCVVQGCGLPVVWIKGRGWAHDVTGHPVQCLLALQVVENG